MRFNHDDPTADGPSRNTPVLRGRFRQSHGAYDVKSYYERLRIDAHYDERWKLLLSDSQDLWDSPSETDEEGSGVSDDDDDSVYDECEKTKEKQERSSQFFLDSPSEFKSQSAKLKPKDGEAYLPQIFPSYTDMIELLFYYNVWEEDEDFPSHSKALTPNTVELLSQAFDLRQQWQNSPAFTPSQPPLQTNARELLLPLTPNLSDAAWKARSGDVEKQNTCCRGAMIEALLDPVLRLAAAVKTFVTLQPLLPLLRAWVLDEEVANIFDFNPTIAIDANGQVIDSEEDTNVSLTGKGLIAPLLGNAYYRPMRKLKKRRKNHQPEGEDETDSAADTVASPRRHLQSHQHAHASSRRSRGSHEDEDDEEDGEDEEFDATTLNWQPQAQRCHVSWFCSFHGVESTRVRRSFYTKLGMGLSSPRDIVLYALGLAEVQYLCGGGKLQCMEPSHIAVVQEPTAFPRRACISRLRKTVDNYLADIQDADDTVIAKLSAMCTCDAKCLTAALWHQVKLTTKVSNDGEDVTVSLKEQDRAAREIWASDANNSISTCLCGAEAKTRTADMM